MTNCLGLKDFPGWGIFMLSLRKSLENLDGFIDEPKDEAYLQFGVGGGIPLGMQVV